MKILHVETGRHFLGGPQQVIYLINALRERGVENRLVCPPGSGIDSVARQAGIRVHNLFCAGDLDLPFAYRLNQFIRDQQPDIVHCHSRRGADILGGLAASIADVPAVVSRRVDNTEMRVVATLRYKPFKKVIAISDAIADVLQEHGIEPERVEVIRSAVDAEAFAREPDRAAFRREFEIGADTLTIAAAGQLIPRKGHRYLLRAFADVLVSHPTARLLIFGEGELEDELRAEADELKLGFSVQFEGFRDDLDEFIGCFDIFAHPAVAEGLGVAALKAAAAGVPVVGFAAGGMTEAVRDGETGLLVPPEDVLALENVLSKLLDDPHLRATLGDAGRERVQNEFSIATMADKHLALYESVLNG